MRQIATLHPAAHGAASRLTHFAALLGLLIGGVGCGSLPMPFSGPSPTAYSGDLVPCNDPGGCAVFQDDEPVVIAVVGPMTGDYSARGIAAYQAAQIAADDAGDFNGRQIVVRQFDNQEDGNAYGRVSQKVVADPSVVAVTGPSVDPFYVYEKGYIPIMSGSGTDPYPTHGVISSTFNRLVSLEKSQGVYAADFLAKNLGVKRVAILYDGTYYSNILANGVRDNLANTDVQVVAFDMIRQSRMDYGPVLRQIAETHPDGILYAGYFYEAGMLARQKDDSDVGLDIPIVIGDQVYKDRDRFLQRVVMGVDKVYVTASGAPFSEARSRFDDRYVARFGKQPGDLTNYTWFYYDATMVLIKAIKDVAIESGGTLYIPRQRLMQAVRNTKGYQGLTGEVTCSSIGECATHPTYVAYEVQDGKFVQLPPDYKP